MYVPTKARVALGKLRTTFKKTGINNGRLLDVHYPDRNIVAVLVHNDYAPELKDILSKRGITLRSDFDPCDGRVLKDPKFANAPEEERHQLAQQLHTQRIKKALDHIRGPAKYAVARFFATKNWINKTELDELLATDPASSHSHHADPTDIFITDSPAIPSDMEDEILEEDDSYSMHSTSTNTYQ